MSNGGVPFFDDMNAFKADSIEKNAHNKLIFILLEFVVDKGRAFTSTFRLLNVDRYSFALRITV